MSSLDLQYVTELARHAKSGDANAFAELFAATHQQQYQFCCSFLQDPYLAQEALQETYVQALKNLSLLQDNGLVVNWLTQLALRICLKLKQKHDPTMPENPESITVPLAGKQYTLHQLMNLPFTESQVLIFKSYCGMRTGQIARLTEMSRRDVREYMQSGLRRLPRLDPAEGGQL